MAIEYDRVWVTVPTYWGDYGSPNNPPCIDFDHPTALDGEETLGRTIDSLCDLPGDFHLLVVLAVTHEEYLLRATEQVKRILAPYLGKKKLYLVAPDNIRRFNTAIGEKSLSMDSYGNIRNVQLFVPYCHGADFVVGIDDDEIIEDKAYLEKVIWSLKQDDQTKGLAGPYLDRTGDFRLKGAEALEGLDNLFLKKNFYMNEALKKGMAKGTEVHPNVVAFGGNMVFTREMISHVCHDPYIPRGEDYDYVINAMMKGIRFCFHPDAPIVHLPPDSDGSQAGDNIRKLKADIRRFIYMGIKLEEHRKAYPHEQFDLALLNPYPGAFVVALPLLAEMAKSALTDGYPGLMTSEEIDLFVDQAIATALVKVEDFFQYREIWETLLANEKRNNKVRNLLLHDLTFRPLA